jgi:hypothetical protein
VSSNLPPASAGATNFDDDPRTQLPYFTEWVLANAPDKDEGVKWSDAESPLARRKASLFADMSFLRDRATLLGEMTTGLPRWRVFVYAVRNRPWHDELERELAPRLDIPARNVDFGRWPAPWSH